MSNIQEMALEILNRQGANYIDTIWAFSESLILKQRQNLVVITTRKGQIAWDSKVGERLDKSLWFDSLNNWYQDVKRDINQLLEEVIDQDVRELVSHKYQQYKAQMSDDEVCQRIIQDMDAIFTNWRVK